MITVYAICRGLSIATTEMMAKRAIQLGGKQWHYLFCLPTGRNLSSHQISKQAILKIIKSSRTYNFIKLIDIIFNDEIGQVSAEFLSSIDITLRRVRNNNIFLGGLLIIGTIDHKQIQPIEGKLFLTSCHIIPYFRIVELKHSAKANGDPFWQRIQESA